MTEVFTVLWFDTEDFITPESHDIPLRIAKLMEKHGVKVVFKLVGEKLRALEKSGRKDVIEALSKHDIGYHTNLHSIHPIMSEYVGDLGWNEGMHEFETRERPGYDEIKKVFGKVTCFGHPGLSWVPQSYPVLDKWGVKVYLDETFTLETMDERPFWYGNLLNIQCIRSNVLTLDASGTYNPDGQGLIRISDAFSKIYEKLESQEKPGIISIFCHPTTYATKEFWDVINFSRGKNPPAEYKKPKLKSRAETDQDFEYLEKFIVSAKALPHLHFITASDAFEIYHDRAQARAFSKDELGQLCESSLRSITFKTIGDGVWVSAAEIFAMVLAALSSYSHEESVLETTNIIFCDLHPLGPTRASDATTFVGEMNTDDLLKSCSEEYNMLKEKGFLPALVRIGKAEISTLDYFATCCSLYLALFGEKPAKKAPEKVSVQKGNFEVGKMVSEEGAKRDWSYYLSAEGFEAREQVKLARLQTWTLKPAVPDLERLPPQID